MFTLPTVPTGPILAIYLLHEGYGNTAVLLLGPQAYRRSIEVSERLGVLARYADSQVPHSRLGYFSNTMVYLRVSE